MYASFQHSPVIKCYVEVYNDMGHLETRINGVQGWKFEPTDVSKYVYSISPKYVKEYFNTFNGITTVHYKALTKEKTVHHINLNGQNFEITIDWGKM